MNDELSTHQAEMDERNATVLVSVNGKLVRRDKAVISVFDRGLADQEIEK